MIKKFLFIFFIYGLSHAQIMKFGEAKGFFLEVGVGPRIPIGAFSDRQNLSSGFNATLSYTDNLILPVFIYGKIGYEHFPGAQELYKETDYSSYSSNVIPMNLGIRYFFKPLFSEVVLLMPMAEAGLSFYLFENLHQFKIDSGKSNFIETKSEVGFHVGAGISMFLLDIIAYYNYTKEREYISLDLKARIPIFVQF